MYQVYVKYYVNDESGRENVSYFHEQEMDNDLVVLMIKSKLYRLYIVTKVMLISTNPISCCVLVGESKFKNMLQIPLRKPL